MESPIPTPRALPERTTNQLQSPVAVSAVGIVKTSFLKKWARRSKEGRLVTDQIPYVCRIKSAACSPIRTQVAIVFPVVMRGMIEASAMRKLSRP